MKKLISIIVSLSLLEASAGPWNGSGIRARLGNYEIAMAIFSVNALDLTMEHLYNSLFKTIPLRGSD
jgi:hypothetical protein